MKSQYFCIINFYYPLRKLTKNGIMPSKCYYKLKKGEFCMAQPKKHTSPRKTGLRRSHLKLKLARRVNATSPVKVKTTKRETGKN